MLDLRRCHVHLAKGRTLSPQTQTRVAEGPSPRQPGPTCTAQPSSSSSTFFISSMLFPAQGNNAVNHISSTHSPGGTQGRPLGCTRSSPSLF